MKGFTIKQNLLNTRHGYGFSLIELMIAMSLSLLLMLAVYKVFDIQQHGFELISALNDREDNAQLAIKILSDDIRMADHWGGVTAQKITHIVGGLSVAPGDCDRDWVFDLAESVYGIEGGPSAKGLKGLPNKCLKNRDYLNYSDLIALKFADSHNYFYESDIDNKRYQKHYFIRAQSGKGGVLFPGKQLASAVQTLPDEGFHYNMLLSSSLYFLRPCPNNTSACVAGSSVLTRLTLKGDRYIQEALVEGIEQMQFEYGIDENQNHLVDRYVRASQLSDWEKVLSVRIYLLVRSRLQDKTLDEKNKIYVMNSANSQTDDVYQVPERLRHYPRKLYQSEVSLRNRLIK